MAEASFRIPLNLPHAALVSVRMLYHLRQGKPAPAAMELTMTLALMLEPWRDRQDNGPEEEARRVARAAGADRLGQQVRNVFECLELGEEGARISLRAGENPNSLLRPK